jgi:hypothetical protein
MISGIRLSYNVIAGLDPAILLVVAPSFRNRDGRDKPGHDGHQRARPSASQIGRVRSRRSA